MNGFFYRIPVSKGETVVSFSSPCPGNVTILFHLFHRSCWLWHPLFTARTPGTVVLTPAVLKGTPKNIPRRSGR